MKNHYSPLPNGSFPVVPVNTLIRLALGNGTAFDVMVSPTDQGLLFSVVSVWRHGGSYVFNFTPSYAYVGEKLRLLDGDAICFARFIDAQLNAPAHEALRNPVIDALRVVTLTPSIRDWLSVNDPKALEQANSAIRSLVSF